MGIWNRKSYLTHRSSDDGTRFTVLCVVLPTETYGPAVLAVLIVLVAATFYLPLGSGTDIIARIWPGSKLVAASGTKPTIAFNPGWRMLPK